MATPDTKYKEQAILNRVFDEDKNALTSIFSQYDIKFAKIDIASVGDNTIVSADATRKIKVLSYVFVADSAVNVKWKSGATDISGAMNLVANTGVSSPSGLPGLGHILETGVNQALILNLSAAVGIRGHLSYYLEE